LPQGKYSALAANGNLCTTKKLAMPTSFVAQNGVEQHTTTPIVPTGCVKHVKAKKAKKSGKHRKGHAHGKK
jgi:glutaminase